MTYLLMIFLDEKDKPSSSRIFGAIALIVGLVLACIGKSESAKVCTGVAVTLLTASQGKSAVVSLAGSFSSKEKKAEPVDKKEEAQDV